MKKVLFLLWIGFFVFDVFAESSSVLLDEAAERVFFAENKILIQLKDGTLQKLSVKNRAVTDVLPLESIRDATLVTQAKDNEQIFLIVTKNQSLKKLNLKTGKITDVSIKTENIEIKSIGIQQSKRRFAVGFGSGLVGINEQLKTNKKELDYKFSSHRAPVYAIDFSRTGTYLLTASSDNKIKIWETDMFTLVREFDFYGTSNVPVIFSPVGDSIAAASSDTTLFIKNVSGKAVPLKAENGVAGFKFTPDGKFLALQNKRGEIEFYAADTGVLYGVIPTGLSAITDFAFNENATMLAVAGSDKTLMLFDMAEEITAFKNQATARDHEAELNQFKEAPLAQIPEPPVSEKPQPAEERESDVEKSETAEPQTTINEKNGLGEKLDSIEKRLDKIESDISETQNASGEEKTSETAVPEERAQTEPSEAEKMKTKSPASETKPPSEQASGEFSEEDGFYYKSKKKPDAVELGTAFSTYTKNPYYLGSFDVTLGYFFYQWTAPFYFGLDCGFNTDFPNKKFPYDYYLGEKKIHSPYAMDITVTAPIGLYFMPFNNDVAFRTELSAGLLLRRLWNGSTKASVHTKFHPLATIDFKFLVEYRYIAGVIGVHYDTSFKFAVTAGLKFMIPIWYKKRGDK